MSERNQRRLREAEKREARAIRDTINFVLVLAYVAFAVITQIWEAWP